LNRSILSVAFPAHEIPSRFVMPVVPVECTPLPETPHRTPPSEFSCPLTPVPVAAGAGADGDHFDCDRLRAVGTLAAGASHEINNPLAFIIGNLDCLLETTESITPGEIFAQLGEIRAMLIEARAGAERIRKIVAGLRTFARERTPAVPVALDRVLGQGISAAASALRGHVGLEYPEVTGLFVFGHEARLAQALARVLENAAEAFPRADPSTQHVEIDVDLVAGVDRDGGAIVRLEVRDNGPGMAPDVERQAMDPFFTTRSAEGHTGLGLSVAHGILADAGGRLHIETAPGRGTTVRFELRAAAAHPGLREDPRPRVLVIDDDSSLLASTAFLLDDVYRIDALADPVEAVRVLDRTWFDVVLCDVSMPRMSGPEVLAAVRARIPAQAERFVFFTGGIARGETERRLQAAGCRVLRKPVRPEEIRRVVAEVVAGGRPTPHCMSPASTTERQPASPAGPEANDASVGPAAESSPPAASRVRRS